jgi:DNA modification methylase
LYQGDAAEVLSCFEKGSINCAITSPPYFGLRDYGVEGQIGNEDTLDEYIDRLVGVFRSLWDALADDGVFWLNLSDSYAANRSYQVPPTKWQTLDFGRSNRGKVPAGFKPKDLIPVSWMTAIALQQDGWYLRAPVIWHKSNAQPTSAKDRPGLDHEYLFMLTKRQKYFFDMSKVKVPAKWERWGKQTTKKHHFGSGWIPVRSKEEIEEMAAAREWPGIDSGTASTREGTSCRGHDEREPMKFRNLRTVWTIPTANYSGAHFATFPPKLVERCINATCPEDGIVLDPFIGSGTVAMQARKMGRKAVGIDLKKSYLELTLERVRSGK